MPGLHRWCHHPREKLCRIPDQPLSGIGSTPTSWSQIATEEVQVSKATCQLPGTCGQNWLTKKVANWPVPTTAKDVQQFLGFTGYYKRFVKDFAQISQPLYLLTERKTPFRRTKECDSAFKELWHCLVTAPIIANPDFSGPFILDTDANDTRIGTVLSQQDHMGKERDITYASCVLSKPKRKYCVTRWELLAVVHSSDHTYLVQVYT